MRGPVRAFLIALAVSLGIPLVLILLAASTRVAAIWYTHVVSPRLVYAYPAYLFAGPGDRVAATWISLAQMVCLSAVFAGFARRQLADRQFAWAVVAFIGWWALCRVVLGWLIIPPNVGTHL